ncbi:MAG: hypothetical protein Q9163_004544 [Psora crenata]
MVRASSGASTPSPPSQTPSSYLSYPVSHIATSLYRRLTEQPPNRPASKLPTHTFPNESANDLPNGVYTPPHRTASPFQPPPLTPLTLSGATKSSILSKAVAEEIRLLVPPRLQLAETWSLIYSLSTHGVSLATLYNKATSPLVPRNSSFVLVIQDATGGIFGAYLTDAPKPSPSFYGTGECFLWRASILPSTTASSSPESPASSSALLAANLLPLPPSADTEGMGRSTTIAAPTYPTSPTDSQSGSSTGITSTTTNISQPQRPTRQLPSQSQPNGHQPDTSTTTTPGDSIRFKAFPYSGVNDYLIFCQHDYLSIGGGDGKYGLWLDEVLETGVSGSCMTFGNERLSEEGEKFEVVGVEMWCVGG